MNASGQSPLWDQQRLNNPHAQADKARRVMAMFDAIAPTYERVNGVLSLGRDAAWRRKLVELAQVRPGMRVLDLACGTGDVVRAFARSACPPTSLIGVDFSQNMLKMAARSDFSSNQKSAPCWLRADATRLPFADESFDVVTIAFGFRNLQDPEAGWAEMFRVLRPGGRCLILEFDLPRNTFLRQLYLGYFTQVLPRLATWISGDKTGAYDYLPQSVKTFLKEEEIGSGMHLAGFDDLAVTPLTFGVAKIYRGTKPMVCGS